MLGTTARSATSRSMRRCAVQQESAPNRAGLLCVNRIPTTVIEQSTSHHAHDGGRTSSDVNDHFFRVLSNPGSYARSPKLEDHGGRVRGALEAALCSNQEASTESHTNLDQHSLHHTINSTRRHDPVPSTRPRSECSPSFASRPTDRILGFQETATPTVLPVVLAQPFTTTKDTHRVSVGLAAPTTLRYDPAGCHSE